MSDDDTKAVPSLADDLAQLMADDDCACGTYEGVVVIPCPDAERYRSLANAVLAHPKIDAALRAVEAVRAFPALPEPCPDRQHHPEWCAYCNPYNDAVKAVQALLEGEK